MTHNYYQEVREYSHEEALAALRRDIPEELQIVVVGVALYETDMEFAEEFCLELVDHSNEYVRGNAILGFGHIARNHGRLKSARIQATVEDALMDGSDHIRGQAWAAASDLRHYLGWNFEGLDD